MPHVIVKLWPGKSEQQNVRLADGIVTESDWPSGEKSNSRRVGENEFLQN
jgi:hypothetical protein